MKKHLREDSQGKLHEKAATGIAGMIIHLQSAWSLKLGKFAGKYSVKKQKIFFICFFTLTLTGNVWLTLSSLKKGKALYPAPEIARISLPVIHKSAPDRDTAGLYRAEEFLLWFDGQEKTAEGKRKQDSITADRPGLVDSVRGWVKSIKESAER